jgi:hypothetical protein
MSVTVCQRGSAQETTVMPAEALLATRAVDFEELFGELVEEAGRALEEGDEGWCAMLQEYLIPQIEAEALERVMNSAEKPHWDADSSVSSVLRRAPVFHISKPFLSKLITRSKDKPGGSLKPRGDPEGGSGPLGTRIWVLLPAFFVALGFTRRPGSTNGSCTTRAA